MTVRDLANELGLTTKQAIDALWTLGIAATGGETTLTPDMVQVARQELPRLVPPAPAPKAEPKSSPSNAAAQPKAPAASKAAVPQAEAPSPAEPPAPPAPVKKVTKYLPSGHRRRRKVQP